MALVVSGTIGGILQNLHDLSKGKDNHNLPNGVRRRMISLIAKLENIQSALSGMSSEAEQPDLQVNLWIKDAGKLSNYIENLITKFESRLPASPAGDIVGRIKLFPTTVNAGLKLAQGLRIANRKVREFVKRHERYRIDDYGVFPFRPTGSSSDPAVNEQRDQDMGKEMATEEELDALFADADHVYKLPSRVKEDMEFLKSEMQIMAVVLQKIAELPAGEVDVVTEAWADDMRDVSRNIKHAVDDLKVQRREGTAHNLTMSSKKARRQFASKIRGMKRSLLEVADRRQRYDLRELRVPKLNSSNDNGRVGTRSRLPDKIQDGELPAAIEEHRLVLVKLLMDQGTTSKQQLKTASVVGVSGVGKTTLAKVVYSSLAESFDCKAWVSIPNLPDMKGVLLDLLRQIEGCKDQLAAPETLSAAFEARDAPLVVKDEKDVIDKICQSLQDKRYFFVIDDLWDLASWNTLKKALTGKSNGSAVLTTSRRVDIAEHVGGVYQLDPLSKTDSISLFCKTLPHTEDNFPTGLFEKLEVFIENCGGIPAKIISAAASLASNPWTVKEWYEVHDSSYYKVEQGPDETTRILDKSYSELPFHLNRCLLYLCLFRKGCEISAEQLLWQWIAEGFIQEIQGKKVLQVAESYLKELIKRKFLKSVEVDAEGNVVSCSVYDLVYDLILSKSSELNFAKVVDGGTGRTLTGEVQRLSIRGNSSDQPTLKVSSSDLRTLMVYSDTNLMPPLSGFRLLRVLDLGSCDSLKNDHLKGIGNLFVLKYLAIGGNCLTGLPKEIVRLKLLQTLDLRMSGLKELPESLVDLQNLERLCVNSHMKVPDWIGKMGGLKELGDINITKPELLKVICKLVKLRILRIVIWVWDESYNGALLEYLRSLVQGRHQNIQSLRDRHQNIQSLQDRHQNVQNLQDRHQNIQSLSVLTCCSVDFMDNLDEKWNPPGLEKLKISDSAFLKLPRWLASLDKLSTLTIEVYKLSQPMVDILGKLPSLCTLSLTSKRAPEGKFGMVPDGFKNLTSFRFACSAMGQLFASEPKAMQMLKRLQLSFKALQTKDKNEYFSFGMEYLCSLEHVGVEIICFNANRLVVENAEAAIRDAISRGRSRYTILEIRRLREGDMIESEENEGEEKERGKKVELSSVKEEQQKETKHEKSSSWKIRVISKKFRQKRRVTKNYRILSLNIKSHMLTLQAV